MLAMRFVALTVAAVSAAFFPSVTILVAVAVAEGVASVFVRPTTAALLLSVTRRPEDLVRAHAALGFADNVGVLVGPVGGGLMLASTTPYIAFATSAALALGSFVTAIRVRVDAADLVQLNPAAGLRHALAEATRGARDVVGRDVRAIALVTALTFAVSGASEVFVVALAIDELRWGEAGTGLLMACIAGGGLVAGVVLGVIGQRRLGPWFVGAGVAMSIALALIGAAPIAVVAIPACIAFGAGCMLVETASLVQVQSLVPSSAGGRVLGTIEGLGYLAIAAGVWATSQMIERWSMRTSLLGLAAVTMVGTIGLAWALLRADTRVAQSRERIGALDGIALFAPLPNALRERIATQIETLDVAADDVVIYQGEYGDSFYVVEAGTLEAFVNGRQVGSLGPNDFFGELALLADTPRTATVRAATECRLWVLPRRAFLSVLAGFAATGTPSHVRPPKGRRRCPRPRTIVTTPSRGFRCSPTWTATLCRGSQRLRLPSGTASPRSCSARTTPPATFTSFRTARSSSVKPANASVFSVRACSSAREPHCGWVLPGQQRPPLRRALCCYDSLASRSAPLSHHPETRGEP